jgi:hypothetical protein
MVKGRDDIRTEHVCMYMRLCKSCQCVCGLVHHLLRWWCKKYIVSDWESTSPLPMCIRSLNCLKNMCAYIEANLWSDGLVVVSGIHNLLGAGLL